MENSKDRSRSPVTRVRGFLRYAPAKVGYVHGPRIMSALRKRWVLLRNPQATVRFGQNVYLGPGFSLHIPGPGTFIVGDNVEFRRNFRAEIAGRGRIEIGSGSYLTYDVILACSTTIKIGERCGLAQATFVADGNHRYRDLDKAFLSQGYDFRPIEIEDDAQIHSKCTIVADIGRRAVIGANAVVSRPVPAYTLAVGVPARPIDYFGPPGGEPPGLARPPGVGSADGP
jgi:acetyltransferase-like isoleucine patch superfamily enzyme